MFVCPDLDYTEGERAPVPLETRVSSTVLAKHRRRSDPTSVNGETGLRRAVTNYIVPLVVNRAASSTAMGQLEAFYVGGMVCLFYLSLSLLSDLHIDL